MKKKNLLPEALNNYLLRLGWGYKDKEYFSTQEAIELFSTKGIGKSPSRFDAIKLKSINSYYFKKLTNDQILKKLKPEYSYYNKKKISQLIDLFKNRAENIDDIEEGLSYMCNDIVKNISEDALKLIDKADKNIMIETINKLEKIDFWEASNLEKFIKAEVKKNNIRMFDIAAPIRSSITGKTYSPSIFLVLEKLGKEVSIKRLKNNYYLKDNER